MLTPQSIASCLTHTNTLWCLSILVTGGHMEWNTNSDKLILYWLDNRTPPSCIQVNLLSVALAINPNFDVVKEIPCVIHIQVLRTVVSDVTQAVSGKTIAESTKIKQLYTDRKIHKGTEIVNVICSIINKDNQLKTICLVGDIIPEDATSACQILAIANQFSKSGQLLERWYKETHEIYANHNDLPDFLAQIPRKECLCILRNLGASILSENCRTDRCTQSRTYKMIIDVARTKGITYKMLLVHHFGHCQNHIQNGWCNEVAIGFGKRAGDAMADSLPFFVVKSVCSARDSG